MEVPKEILEVLKCGNCEDYISYSPVYLKHNGFTICGRCFVTEEKEPECCNRLLQYEAAARFLRFPCKYREFGCKETVPFSEDFQEKPHEQGCVFRNYECPIVEIDCDWSGMRQTLIEHFQSRHPNHIVKNPCNLTYDITHSSVKSYIVNCFDVLFLLHTKICIATGKIYHAVRLLDNPEKLPQFKYTLEIKRDELIISRGGIIAPQNCANIEENSIVTNINSMLDILDGYFGTIFIITIKKLPAKPSTVPKQVKETASSTVAELQQLMQEIGKPSTSVPTEGRFCRNKYRGCSFSDIEIKCDKHEEFFCQYRSWCWICWTPVDHTATEAAKTYVIPDRTVTQEGGSYVVMLKHDTAVPTECFIENDFKKYSVELSQRGITPSPVPKNAYLIQPKADDTDIITSLGNGICGFKMDSVSANSPYNWTISFVDQNRNTYYSTTTVTVRIKTPRHIIKYNKVGSVLTVDCEAEIQDFMYCKLYNPQNQLIEFGSDCYHFVHNSTLSDFGVWKCLLNFKTHMMPREDVFEFIPIATDIVQTWTNQTDNYVNIGCSVTNSTEPTEFCLMTRPDGQEIVVSPGLATKRYMAIDTNVDNCMCSLQITLPLEKSEKGLWRCEQFNSFVRSSVGGYISVSAHESSYTPVPKIPSTVLAQINSTLALTCQVPFSSSYCYMRGPDGFLYPVHNSRKSSLGECEFVKETAQVTDNGTWICGFGRTTGEPDSVYSFQVYIPEPIQIQPKVEEIESRTAGTARLVCTTSGLGDSPLKYCRFLSPDGKMYQIENHQISDKMSYEGRGLEYGDCGIMLHDVSASDQGTWSCITHLERLDIGGEDKGTEEVYTNIHLTVNDSLSVASILGITFGVIIVVIAGAVFFIYRYVKRSNYQTALLASGVNPRLSQTSNATIQDNAGPRGYSSTDLGARYRSGALRNSSQSGGNDTSENIVEFDTIEDSTNNRIVNLD